MPYYIPEDFFYNSDNFFVEHVQIEYTVRQTYFCNAYP